MDRRRTGYRPLHVRADPPRLEKINADNVLAACRIQVAPEHDKFVTPAAESLADASASPDVAWPRLIVHGDEPVGFVMAFDVRFDPENLDDRLRSGFWRLNIAAAHQDRGYGRFAVEAVCEEIRRRGGTRVTVTWKPGEHGPDGFYRALGFRPTGELSEDELVGEMDLPLQAPQRN